jgi:hypothetical protein
MAYVWKELNVETTKKRYIFMKKSLRSLERLLSMELGSRRYLASALYVISNHPVIVDHISSVYY